jgi:hypothetical protein
VAGDRALDWRSRRWPRAWSTGRRPPRTWRRRSAGCARA